MDRWLPCFLIDQTHRAKVQMTRSAPGIRYYLARICRIGPCWRQCREPERFVDPAQEWTAVEYNSSAKSLSQIRWHTIATSQTKNVHEKLAPRIAFRQEFEKQFVFDRTTRSDKYGPRQTIRWLRRAPIKREFLVRRLGARHVDVGE